MLLFSSLVSQSQDLPAGKLIEKVYCLSDSNQHYALYLPSYYYTADIEEWPVIYAFDAAARGSMPVELFLEAAEKYGYIIAGSNVSENGPWEPILKAAEAMFKDTEARLKIDSTRRYTTGFSGGARVATSIAVLYGTFEGVIGCGAGFSNNYPPNFAMEFNYINLIGDRDFNYQEIRSLDDRLDKYNISHYVYEYPGEHEWPPKEVITDAVTWLEFRAMEDEVKWTDYGMREDFYEANKQLILDLINENREYDAYKQSEKLLSYLHGIRDLRDIEEINANLKRTEAVSKQRRYLTKLLAEERDSYIQFSDAFVCYRINFADSMTPVKPNSWWKEQIKAANDKLTKGENPMDTLLGRRMLDFIWRTAYMQYESVQGTEYQTTAKYFLDIWAMAVPDAISPYFFLAKYYAEQGKYEKALKSLEEAVSRGLSDISLIENDSALVNLTTMPEYRRVVMRLDSKQN